MIMFIPDDRRNVVDPLSLFHLARSIRHLQIPFVADTTKFQVWENERMTMNRSIFPISQFLASLQSRGS